MAGKLIDLAEAAQVLSVPPDQVRVIMERAGFGLAAVKQGAGPQYNLSDVRAARLFALVPEGSDAPMIVMAALLRAYIDDLAKLEKRVAKLERAAKVWTNREKAPPAP